MLAKAFGQDGDGFWTPPGATSGLAIPYIRRQYKFGPFTIPVVSSATNDHAPRYYVLGEMGHPGDVFLQMMQGLIEFREDSPYVDCPSDWDSYWSSRGKSKSTWRRRERKIFNAYDASFEYVSDLDHANKLLPEILAVEASR